jgi:hypothetical protein
MSFQRNRLNLDAQLPSVPQQSDSANTLPWLERLRTRLQQVLSQIARVTRELQEMPVCIAYPSAAATNLTLSGTNSISVDTKVVDTHSWFNTTTHRYVPQKAGYYRVTWAAQVNGGTAGAGAYIMGQIIKNGAEYAANLNQLVSSGGATFFNANAVVPLNGVADYLEFWITNSVAAGTPQLLGNVASRSYVAIEYIGATPAA